MNFFVKNQVYVIELALLLTMIHYNNVIHKEKGLGGLIEGLREIVFNNLACIILLRQMRVWDCF